ncbi:MAG: hypothetical protein WC686_01505 [Candidatus Shapirobacteria bacterium]|jgi:hypothetical protein
MNLNKITSIILGLFSLYYLIILLSSFHPSLAARLTKNNTSYGDLFQMSKVTDFKIPIPQILPLSKSDPISDADIILMGDSFFNVTAGYPDFASQLRSSLGLKIHNYNIHGAGEPWRRTNPLDYLSQESVQKSPKKRTLILESVDRGISQRFLNIPTPPVATIAPAPKTLSTVSSPKIISDSQPPIGSIDLVNFTSSTLHLEGWAADFESKSPLSRIDILLNDQIIGNAVLSQLRPDVSLHFDQAGWDNSGWFFTQSLVLAPGRYQISARFVDNAGNVGHPNKSSVLQISSLSQKLPVIKSKILSANLAVKEHLKKIDFLLAENHFNSSVAELVATINFRFRQQISPLTPKYSLNPKLLFYRDEVEFCRSTPSLTDITKIADNLAYISNRLKTDYNIDFIFMPMPTKYTILHHLANDFQSYDFFPELYKLLDQKKVRYIDLYHPFSQSADILYLSSDTHWNHKGVTVGTQQTLKIINNAYLNK